MLTFCQEEGIPFERCGKVIVALDEHELPRLEDMYRRGIANGVQGLELIGPERLRELEPFAAGIKAIYSPNTGITDFGKVAQAYARNIQHRSSEIITGCQGAALSNEGKQIVLLCTQLYETGADAHTEIEAHYDITCAGLQADKLTLMSGNIT